MELFQILDCSSVVGNCCGNPGMASLFDITRKIFEVIQIVAPMVLLIAGTIQFTQLTINPEMKDGFRRVLNKFMAAFFIFFIPFLVDAVLNVVPGNVDVAACWQQAKRSSELARTNNYTYIEEDKEGEKFDPFDLSKFDVGQPDPPPTPGASRPNEYFIFEDVGSGTASTKGQAIVQYASQFVGQKYKYAGTWNGELPYTPTDCSGFVKGVFAHFGVKNLPHGTNSLWRSTNLYTRVDEKDLQPGDLVMYDGHVAIYTGKGREIIHAASTKLGVIRSKDYRSSSSHSILGFLRIKGVK